MLQNKTVNKIISVIIALCLWSYVIIEQDPVDKSTIKDVPVTILNEENLLQRGLTLVGEQDFTIDVGVTGKRGVLNKLKKEDITATVDVYGRTFGMDQVLEVNIDVPDSVQVFSKKQSITLNIDELVAVQKPISVRFEGEFKPNTEPGNIAMQPEQIEVKGARSLVEQVSYLAAVVPADRVTAEGATINVELAPTSAAGERVENVTLSSATVDITVKLVYIKEVPLHVEVTGEVAPEYHVTGITVPVTVSIRGPRDELAQIDEVTAAAIDISQVTASTEIPLTFAFPEDVELADASSSAAVIVSIEGAIASRVEIPTSSIAIEGLAEEWTAYINTGTVVVTATGSEELAAAMAAADFTLSVDVSQLSGGSHAVPVTVQSQKAFRDIKVEPAEIYVTINEPV